MNLSPRAMARIRDAAGPLLLDLGDPGERVVKLGAEKLRIGSAAEADLRFPANQSAPAAAEVRAYGSGFVVVAEAPGALVVDGRPVVSHILANGSRFTVAGHELIYVDPRAEIMPAGLQLLHGAPTGLPAPTISARLAEGEDFGDMLIDRLRSTPWLLISLFFHALIFFTVVLLQEEPELPRPLPEITAELTAMDEDDDLPFVEDLEEIEPEPLPVEDVSVPELETPEPPSSQAVAGVEDARTGETEDLSSLAPGVGDVGDYGGAAGGAGATRGPGEAASGSIQRSVGKLRASGLDIVFLIDATASMDQEIATTKSRLSEMIALLEGLGIRFRIGVVAFRDRDTGDAFVTHRLELTPLLYKAVHFLDGLRAEGGGDIPEAVLDAVEDGTRMSWSRGAERVIVLVGDAPPKPGSVAETLRTVERFAEAGGVVHTIYTQQDRGDFHDGRAIFARIAEAGGGRAIELSGEDGVVEDVTLLALETEDRGSIRRMLASLDASLSVRVLRGGIERGDVEMVTAQLRRKEPRSDLPIELMRANSRGEDTVFVPAYLATLDDAEAPEKSRWLAKLLIERTIERLLSRSATGAVRKHLRAAAAAVATIDPERAPSRDRRALGQLAQALLDAELLPAPTRAAR